MGTFRAVGILLALSLLAVGCSSSGDTQGPSSSVLPRPAAPVLPQPGQALQLPAAGQLYHGVYVGDDSGQEDVATPALLDAYENAVGRQVAWVYFSHNWFNGTAFPAATAEWIRARGSVPYIRLMLRSSQEIGVAEPRYTLEAILRGDFDAELRAWGQAARAFGTPIIVEWGTEANGDWFSWNGAWNGGPGTGPALFREAFRYLVYSMKNQGAYNITWVWHVNASDFPSASWNALENYFPGNDIVDWIGLSVYAAQSQLDPFWYDFGYSLDFVMPRLSKIAPYKPVIVAEFGAPKGNPIGTPEVWADWALSQMIAGRWPSLKGFSWWNEAWSSELVPGEPLTNVEMRVQQTPQLAQAFRQRLNNPAVISDPIFR
ncbi:MAG: glycosyl hydrolase [Meiothermus sp.]|nr:glycosyl hydrolase [Meiothermus sp.]